MCLYTNLDGEPVWPGEAEDGAGQGAEHPSQEQFSMLLNLLPPSELVRVTSHAHSPPLASLPGSLDEADILMAAVNYILSLTSQLQQKLRRSGAEQEGGEH